EFHVDLIYVDLLDGVGRAEAVLEHGAGAQVAELGLNEGAQVTRGAVLHFEDGVQLPVVLDDHARTHLGCWDRHASNSPWGNRRRAARKCLASFVRTERGKHLILTLLESSPTQRRSEGGYRFF